MAYTEAFTGSDGTSPPNGNWTNQNAVGIKISSNEGASGTDGSYGFAFYSAGTFANDQYAFCTITRTSGICGGPSVRASADNCYWLDCNDSGGGDSYVWERLSGSFTLKATLGTTWAAGNKAKIEITSTTIKVYKDTGSGYVQVGSDIASGGNISSGKAGVGCLSGTAVLDTWEGGDLGGGGGGKPFHYYQQMRRQYRREQAARKTYIDLAYRETVLRGAA